MRTVPFGALAQLGERLICIQEVSGSIPLGSTISSIRSQSTLECFAVQSDACSFDCFDIVKRDTNSTLFDRPREGGSQIGLLRKRFVDTVLPRCTADIPV